MTHPLLVVVLALALLTPSALVARAQGGTPIAGTPATEPVDVVWQTTGGPDLPFDDPFQLTVDAEGNLWVADGNNSRFQVFAPDGTFLEMWGTPGSAEGQFDFIEGARGNWDPSGAIAFDRAGNHYVADPGNHRVQKFDPDRAFLTSWGSTGLGDGQFLHPYDIAVDAADRVYVIDDGRDDIQVFDGDGRFLAAITKQGFDAGQLYDTGGLAIAPDGTLWVADWGNNRVQAFSPAGAFEATVGERGSAEGQFRGPTDVAVDRQGRVFVADNGNDRVQVFAGDGGFLTAFGGYGTALGDLASPAGIAVGSDGTLYVSEVGTDRVTAVRPLPPVAAPVAGTPVP